MLSRPKYLFFFLIFLITSLSTTAEEVFSAQEAFFESFIEKTLPIEKELFAKGEPSSASPPESSSQRAPYVQSLSPCTIIDGLIDMQSLTYSSFYHDMQVDRLGDLKLQHGLFQNGVQLNFQSFIGNYYSSGCRPDFSIIEPFGAFFKFIENSRTVENGTKVRNLGCAKDGLGWDSLVNTSNGEISGRTNLKNLKICFRGPSLEFKDWHLGQFEATYGHCGKKIYRSLSQESPDDFHLVLENLPNSRQISFEYKGDWKRKRFEKIILKNKTGKPLASLTQRFDHKNQEYIFEGSNGKKVAYQVDWLTGSPLLKKITAANGIQTTFESQRVYYFKEHEEIPSLFIKPHAIRKPDGRFYLFKYESEEANAPITHLQVPDSSGEPATLYQFSSSKDPFSGAVGNITTVKDAYNGVRSFTYGRKKLSELAFGGPEGYFRRQRFFWDKDRLIATAVLDKENIPRSAWLAAYDSFGNILRERVTGNLTGKELRHLGMTKYWSDGPNWDQKEFFDKVYTYSTDSFNLKLSEQEDLGPRIEYSYLEGTNLLANKLTLVDGVIRQREFFTYDEDANLVCHMRDDGQGRSIDDLSGVTERHLTRKTYVQEGFGFGQVKEIASSYLDLKTMQEMPLTREVFFYETCDRVIQKELYDCENVKRYTLYYSYDERGNLLSETDPLGVISSYKYDANNNRVRSEKEGTSFYTLFTYDYRDNLIQEEEVHTDGTVRIRRFTYDLKNRRTSETDAFGQTTYFKYDAHGRMIRQQLPPLLCDKGEAISRVKTLKYDMMDRVSEETDELGFTTKYEYNDYGDRTKITYADQTVESFLYQLNGLLEKHVKKNGSYVLYTYDKFKRPLKQETYSAKGKLLSTERQEWNGWHQTKTIDAMGNITCFHYNGAGQKVSEEKEVNGKTERFTYHYDALGRLVETRSYFGEGEQDYISTIEEKDLLGRVVAKKLVDGIGKLLSKEEFTYDILGNVICHSVYRDSHQKASSLATYNSFSLPVLLRDALGQETRIEYKLDFVNALGQEVLKVTKTDPMGNQTVEVRTPDGNTASLKKFNPFGMKTFDQEVFYDARGLVTLTLQHVLQKGEELRTYSVERSYDSMGRLKRVIEEPLTEKKQTSYTYTKSGELETLEKPDGVTLLHSYDDLGCLTALKSSDRSIDYTYAYDLNKNLLEWKDCNTGLFSKRECDERGRVLKESFKHYAVQYAYDLMGRMTSCELPNNKGKIRYQFSGVDLKEVQREDANGQTLYHHRYKEVDFNGRILESELPKSLGRSTHSYDLLGRKRSITSPSFSLSIPEGGYDAASNLTAVHIEDAIGEMDYQYTYDDLYQITSEKGHAAHEYAYDSIHNRLQKDSDPYAITRLNQVASAGSNQYFYDRAGNLIEKRSGGAKTTYSYDALNRLVQAEEVGKWKMECRYDFSGRRLDRKISDWQGEWKEREYQEFLYQKGHEIGSLDRDGQCQELRLLGKGVSQELGAAVALEIRGELFIPMHDQRGNVVAILDGEDGSLQEAYRYTSFGEMEVFSSDGQRIESSAIDNPWTFASKRKDKETGFVYFSQRYYDPILGSFVTPDPSGFSDGPNLYAYVHANPLSLIDPFGLKSEKIDPTYHDPFKDRPERDSSASQGSQRHEEAEKAVQQTERKFEEEDKKSEEKKAERSFFGRLADAAIKAAAQQFLQWLPFTAQTLVPKLQL
ncbi:MAG: rhs family protein [Chlamydiales bacterium]|jgi:RHS repeat-associated protein|nr:rhs family protein [Chlamydiales bacterium]